MLAIVAAIFGATSGICMADAVISPLPNAGVGVTGSEGGATVSTGQEAVPGLYMADVDQRITKMRPMASPIDQISRFSHSSKASAQEVEFYSVSTRPVRTTLGTAIAEQTSGITVELISADAGMFTKDDTIRVLGVKGFINGDESQPSAQDLVLHVAGSDNTSNNPVVFAVNGLNNGTSGVNTWVPAIPAGTILIRMGKACSEIDAQTSQFYSIPTKEPQYCQNFMLQVEESTFNKMTTTTEVPWNFSDIEEAGIYDMRLGMESSFLFGVRAKIKHPLKNAALTYYTGGIWWQAGRDISIGHIDATTTDAIISDDDLVDVARELFTGTDRGSQQKVLFAGSGLLAALSKIKSDKYIYKDSVEKWGLKFKSFDTEFGEVLVLYHDLFDQNGMEDEGLAIDTEYLDKKTFVSFAQNALNLKESGQRNTEGVVIQEVCCLNLRYANAHARVKLAA